MQTHPAGDYRFGPFVVVAGTGELLRNGSLVKLQEQPYRLLLVLLESPGKIVTREDLRARLWQQDTFVDFDGSLRVAVRKLREALDDDAEHPRYIETIPRRGYRFLAPGLVSPSTLLPVSAPQLPQPPVPASSAPLPMRSLWASHSTALSVALACGLILAVAAALWSRREGQRLLSAKDTLVLADFDNRTGDPVFDEALRQGLAVQLEQSPFLSVTSEETIGHTLTLMGKPADTRLTPAVAREICERTAGSAVLNGSIARLDNRYVLGLRAIDCNTGKLLAEQQGQAKEKADVLNTLSDISGRFRSQVGESLSTVAQHNVPLPDATTSSLEALKTYSIGKKLGASQGDAAALPFFRRATEIDPQFALAFAQLGLTYGAIGESALSAASTARAYELRDRASEAERYLIIASYDIRVTGNLEKAEVTCESWAEAYPRDPFPHAYLSGIVLPALAKDEISLAEANKIVAMDPRQVIGYIMVSSADLALDRYDEAAKAQQSSSGLGLEGFFSPTLRYNIAFVRNDPVGMQREVTASLGKAAPDETILTAQAFALAYVGRLRDARTAGQRATQLAQQVNHREAAALDLAGAALREAFTGDSTAARTNAAQALRLSDGREVIYGAALALALSGDSAQSETLAEDLQRRFSEDTSAKFSYLPVLHAMSALHRGDPAKALAALELSAPYDLGRPRSSVHGYYGALYPVYVRGLAYLALHRPSEAAIEFRKIIGHRGIVISDPVGALAQLQFARALNLSGDRDKARAAYQVFLTLWKQADSDVPVLRQSRSEFATLQ